jgi:hypothetical protein
VGRLIVDHLFRVVQTNTSTYSCLFPLVAIWRLFSVLSAIGKARNIKKDVQDPIIVTFVYFCIFPCYNLSLSIGKVIFHLNIGCSVALEQVASFSSLRNNSFDNAHLV